jgi:stage II sporulation protein D
MNSSLKALWVGEGNGAGRGGRPAARMAAPIEARLSAAGWQVTDSAGLIAKFPRTAAVLVSAEENLAAPPTESGVLGPGGGGSTPGVASPSAGVIINGKRYQGVLQLVARTDGNTFDAVEQLPLEEYLKGVVTAEMFRNWPLAAYQAQAVAARSYAISERSRRRALGAGFDVESGTADQAYSGLSDNALAVKAVNDTKGCVLTWNSAVVRAYYSSTCGGRAASARDAWSSDPSAYNFAGPIQGVTRDFACQEATYYRWAVTRSRADLATRLRDYGRVTKGSPLRNLTGVERIGVASVNAAGRPNRFTIMQPGGQTYTVSAEELRSGANHAVAGLPAVTAQTRVHSSDLEAVVVGETVTMQGRGFGHGVGMCQWCAKGFAEKGEAWPAIVTRFYPGARVERVY